ncbi:hypothetical protein [Saccharothrix texasensis]|uniref:MFS transporter n=1 Tax=Saccharothrix texasensis TaxID=103734 RepID=A0A3N1H289_9PSEU|nr:hypothetical protein [Saccharothrix texasensis]ROP36362.1 hypothetical protein EDD40_1628 [Saccharothrix texasensis]
MPSGVPAEAADSLSGALSAAAGLPEAAARALVESARAAFTSGLDVAAVVAAVLVAGAAVLAVTVLRDVPTTAAPTAEPATADA